MDIKDNFNREENRYARNVYLIISVTWTLLLILFGVYLVYKAVNEESAKWRSIGEKINRSSNIILSPSRGTIYSNNGTPMSITAPYYKLYFDFNHDVLRKTKDDSVRKALQDSLNKEMIMFADVIYDKFAKESKRIDKKMLLKRWNNGFNKKSRSTPVLSFSISYLDYKELKSIPPLCGHPNSKGRIVRSLLDKICYKSDEYKRIKPFGSLADRTIGNITTDSIGFTHGVKGLELGYDDYLSGKSGLAVRRYIAGKYSLNVIEPPTQGADLHTTIDMDKQSVLEKEMRKKMTEVDAESGSAILMEVKTGKILAITNLQRIASGHYAETVNYAVSDLSEPGSTFKVASMLVALDEGKVRPNDTIDVGNGVWTVHKRNVRDHNAHKGGYGRISASQAIQFSSNVGLAKIITGAYSQNPDHFVDKLRSLGFGLDLGLRIPGYAKARIRKKSDNEDRWYGTTLAWMSFGYETQIPPIYTLSFYNAIANNGKYMKPYFVDSIVRNGEVLLRNEPKVMIEKIAGEKSLGEIKEMLREVVQKGTGKALKNDLVDISGKSGTAQIAQGGNYRGRNGVMHMVSFCAFFPSENPEYTCIVVIRNPGSGYPGGGSMAGPVIREVAKYIYTQKESMPIDSLSKRISYIKEMPTNANRNISDKYKKGIVPNVVGLTADEAVGILSKCGYRVNIYGYGLVVSQSVAQGTKYREGKTIKINLN